ncbi:unnamed protein product [Caenorhabditis auriculariae]|uniref:7TM GPCR serpentine receptor class x (Srx) domain-containing protein n=1 Tax=Caenorhabditis auriculariae TaxID=2777116 RepID=A0A8S1HS63_9PELO|nr:unnamed protein product [Caenorhabditis auriculariae]
MALTAEDVLATSIIFLFATAGILTNAMSIFVILRTPALRGAFGKICLSHSIANSGLMTIFMGWSIPFTLTSQDDSIGPWSRYAGAMNNLITERWTAVFITIIWTVSIIQIIPFLLWEQCYLAFDTKYWIWTYGDKTCGPVAGKIYGLYVWLGVMVVVSCFDMISLSKLRAVNRNHGMLVSQRSRMETRFFLQACLQNGLFVFAMGNFYFLSRLWNSRWGVFVTQTAGWQISHVIDGLILVLLHGRLRKSQVHLQTLS